MFPSRFTIREYRALVLPNSWISRVTGTDYIVDRHRDICDRREGLRRVVNKS